MKRRLFLCLVPLWLAACSQLPQRSPAERVYAGRFAVTVSNNGATGRNNGRFVLAVQSDGMTLDLNSPIGTTVGRIELDSSGARLYAPDSSGRVRVTVGANAEALTQAVFGWSLPVEGLPDWIEGRPVPIRVAKQLASTDAIAAFEQDGWTVRVQERFETAGLGTASAGAPRRLSIDRGAQADGAPAIQLQLVLDPPQ